MKKFTLLTALMLLMSTLTFAQRNAKLPNVKALPAPTKVLKSIQGNERKASNNMRKAPRKAAELVTPPNEGEPWTVSGGACIVYYNSQYGWVDYTDYISETMKVCIDGSNIYIQGLAAAYFPDGWVKGTISGNKVTIPNGQCVGEDEYGPEYLVGQPVGAETGEEPPVDIVFVYDEAAGTLTLDTESVDAILESGDPSTIQATFAYWVELQLTKGAEPEPELVTPPSEGEEYVMQNSLLIEYSSSANDGEGGYVNSTEKAQNPFYAIIDGSDVYIAGIDNLYFPEGWIKGTLNGNIATFPSGQFVGKDQYGSDFIVGGDTETGEAVENIIFIYNPETEAFTLDGSMVLLITGKATSTNFYYYWGALTIVKKSVVDGINSISNSKNADALFNLQGVKMNRPTQKGVYIQNGRKVIVK